MRISVVMAYYNRKDLLKKTLQSIGNSQFKNFEVIIVDDGSTSLQRIDDLVYKYKFPIRLFRVSPHQKTWINPCMPYNKGFDCVKDSDTVVIQNPECLHVGDVLTHVATHSRDDNYISYACYAVNNATTQNIIFKDLDTNRIRQLVEPFNMIGPVGDAATWMAWYNHASVRPIAYHWCTAISKSNLDRLNGFDERYRNGIGWDDAEFIRRVKRLGLQIDFVPETEPYVIHMYHTSRHKNWEVNFKRNERLFIDTCGETTIQIKREKIQGFVSRPTTVSLSTLELARNVRVRLRRK